METRFSWDPQKDASNIKKHGVSFDVALQAFADPFALFDQDRIEESEQRWQTLGRVDGHFLLLIAHTAWEEDEDGQTVEFIRLISARMATRRERQRYEQQFG